MVGVKMADLEATLFEAPGGGHLAAHSTMVGLYHWRCGGVLIVGGKVRRAGLDV